MDEELELGQSRMSLQKEGQLALLSVHMTYGEAEKVYEELTRNKTGRMTVHRTVQRWGDGAFARGRMERGESGSSLQSG